MALVLSVAGCSTPSSKPVIRTEIVAPALTEEMRKACARPVAIPKRRLTERDVTSLWGVDRRELVACAERHGAVMGALK